MFPWYPEAQRLPSYQGNPLSTARTLLPLLAGVATWSNKHIHTASGGRLEPKATGRPNIVQVLDKGSMSRTLFLVKLTYKVSGSRSKHRSHGKVGGT